MTLVKTANGIYPSINSVFEDFFGNSWVVPTKEKFSSSTPAVNIQENSEAYKIEVAAPGYLKTDFSLAIDNDILTISVDKKEEKSEESDKYSRKEFSYMNFTRKFNLPKQFIDSDRIEAQYENGILEILIPKREEVKPKPIRSIEIQ